LASLITGGLGFIGSHLARKLLSGGEEVILLDIIPHSRLIDDIKDRVGVVRGDLDNWSLVLDTVKRNRIETIYHAGALLSASAEESSVATYKVNANGTLHVLEAARLFDVKTVMFLSTIATYGPGLPDRVGDDAIQRPVTMYGVTKVFGERLGEYYHHKYGMNFRGIRLPSAIGPGRGAGGASAYSSLVVQEAAAGRPYQVFVSEGTKIPLVYIDDAVSAILGLARAVDGGLKRRVYNIQGFSPTAGDLARAVARYVPDARIEFRPQPELDRIANSWPKELEDRDAKRDWGWKSEYPLDRAVRDFVAEFRARRNLYE